MQAFVVTDVHGFYDEMIKALNDAGYDRNNPNHCFVSLGDLLDRGKQPKECLEFVNSLPEKNKILIRGNHEDLLEEAIHRGGFLMHDFQNHTSETAEILTGMSLKEHTGLEICSVLEAYEPLNQYLKSCVDYFENNHVIFVHGWIPCEKLFKGIYQYIPNWREEGNWEDARWVCGFDAWNKGVVEPNKTIWCGHWHTSYGHAVYHNEGAEWEDLAIFTPFEDVGIVGMDACTAYSGFVSCKKIGKFKR